MLKLFASDYEVKVGDDENEFLLSSDIIEMFKDYKLDTNNKKEGGE